MIKTLWTLLKNSFLKYFTDYIAVVDASNLITRVSLYKVTNKEYTLLAIETLEIDFLTKERAIDGLFTLIVKLESQIGITIRRVLINSIMSYITIDSYESSLAYNKNYTPSDLKKIFNTKNILKKLRPNLKFLFMIFKQLHFDNYSLKSVRKKLFIKDIHYVVDVVSIDKEYFNTLHSLFDYLGIEVVDIIPADMILNYFFDSPLTNPSCFIRLDYNKVVVSKFVNNKMIHFIEHDFGLNNLFDDLASKMNLPMGIFKNFYETGYLSKYNRKNIVNKFMLLNYQNVEYNINYVELKFFLDNLIADFLSSILKDVNLDQVDKNSIYVLGELENLIVFSTIIENLVSNKALQSQLKHESQGVEINLSNVKAISMLKYHLYNKGSGLI